MDIEDKKIICKVCLTQFARYICPRCNITYCGLACYKQHNGACTESFYREQAIQQLKGTRADDTHKKELLVVLKRAQRQTEKDARLLQRAKQGDEGDSDSSDSEDDTDEGEEDEEEDDEEGEEEEDVGSNDEEDDEEEEAESQAGASDHEHQVCRDVGSGRRVNGSVAPGPEGQSRAGQGSTSTTGMHLSEATRKKLLKKLRKADLDSLHIDESDLTPEELKAFHRAVTAGRVAHLVRTWQPWWLTPEARTLTLSATGQPLIQQVDQQLQTASASVAPSKVRSQSKVIGQELQQLPPPPSHPLQPVAQLTKAAPSPLLRWQVVELLYAYCFVQRRYNGEACLADNVQDATAEVLALSPALATAGAAARRAQPASQSNFSHDRQSSGGRTAQASAVGDAKAVAVQGAAGTAHPAQQSIETAPVTAPVSVQCAGLPPSSAADAVLRCVGAVCQPPLGDMTSRSMALGVLSDVVAICEAGVPCLVLALTDLHRLLTQALNDVESNSSMHPSYSNSRGHTSREGEEPQGRIMGHVIASKRVVKAAAGKVWFSTCWAHEQGMNDQSASLSDELAWTMQQQLRELLVAQQAGGRHSGVELRAYQDINS